MDKITRILLLYSKLIKGEEINKTLFCFENECSPRSFDRDIEDIRLYLSESFNFMDLTYDRGRNIYFMEVTKKLELEPMEYLLLERILKDTAVLRKDEFEIMTSHLLSNTENSALLDDFKREVCSSYESPLHNKALVKMHGDLVTIIRKKQCIRIRYYKGNGEEVEHDVIPCTIKYDLGYLYFIGYREKTEDNYPAYYRLDRIYSFSIIRNQTYIEQKKVKSFMDNYSSGITQMYGGEFVDIILKCKKDYFSYLYDKFRNVEMISQDDEVVIAKVSAFEEGFIKWMISQSQDMVSVVQPESTKNRLVEEARKIISKYGGVG